MAVFWILFACISASAADVGYEYNKPSTSSSFSSSQGGFSSGLSSTGGNAAFGGASRPQGGSAFKSQFSTSSQQDDTANFGGAQNVNGYVNNNYESSFATSGMQPLPKLNVATNFLNSYGEPITNTDNINTKTNQLGYQQSTGFQNQGFNSGASKDASKSFGSNFQSNTFNQNSRFGSSSTGYVQQTQEPIIKKHFYVHVAPEEPAEQNFRQPPILPPPEKHYKIIFVKVPSQDVQRPAIVQQAPQIEEKTIVYVLVNKQEELEALEIPAPKPTEPSKPEVYFIKYNSQKKINERIGGVASYEKDGSIDSELKTGLNTVFGSDSPTGSFSATQRVSGQDFSNSFGQTNTAFSSANTGVKDDYSGGSSAGVKGSSGSVKVTDQGPLINTLTESQGSAFVDEQKGFKTYGTPKSS